MAVEPAPLSLGQFVLLALIIVGLSFAVTGLVSLFAKQDTDRYRVKHGIAAPQ